jgi:hypothetical protein
LKHSRDSTLAGNSWIFHGEISDSNHGKNGLAIKMKAWEKKGGHIRAHKLPLFDYEFIIDNKKSIVCLWKNKKRARDIQYAWPKIRMKTFRRHSKLAWALPHRNALSGAVFVERAKAYEIEFLFQNTRRPIELPDAPYA